MREEIKTEWASWLKAFAEGRSCETEHISRPVWGLFDLLRAFCGEGAPTDREIQVGLSRAQELARDEKTLVVRLLDEAWREIIRNAPPGYSEREIERRAPAYVECLRRARNALHVVLSKTPDEEVVSEVLRRYTRAKLCCFRVFEDLRRVGS